MKRLELLKSRRPFGAISEDGSGWISVSETAKNLNSDDPNSDISPPRKRRTRNDTPSPEHEPGVLAILNSDMSPPRKRRARNDTPSPEPTILRSNKPKDDDMSPPRKRRARFDTPSPEPNSDPDLSPPRKGRTLDSMNSDLSPPRRGPHRSTNNNRSHGTVVEDLSPPRKKREDRHQRSSDLSPPRKPMKESERPKTGLVSGKDVKEEIAKTKKEELLR